MAWFDRYTTSLFGRRLGLQHLTTNVSGAALPPGIDVIVGAEDIKLGVTTADTTAAYMKAYGVTMLSSGLTAAASAVVRLDPPIPGVRKYINIASTATGVASTINWWITSSTGGGATFTGTTWGSSFTVLESCGPLTIELLGVSTSQWLMFNSSGQFTVASATST